MLEIYLYLNILRIYNYIDSCNFAENGSVMEQDGGVTPCKNVCFQYSHTH